MALNGKTLLIVEDDIGLQKQLRWRLDKYNVVMASDLDSAIVQLRRHEPAVVTMDLGLPPDPDGTSVGLAAIEQILAMAPDTKLIVLTGNQDHASALKAIALGAYDFHHKPCDHDLLDIMIERAFHLYSLQQENHRLRQHHAAEPTAGIISRDPGLLKVCRNIEKVAPSSATVTLLGESGTGKELLARAVHQSSPRRDRRFIAINCAAIPENLLEAELFGYEKGAFTGAVRQTVGKIELAHGGTLFLDEIGDLPLAMQAKLLRFLQERVLERLGGRAEIAVDVRIVCATHRDLKQLAGDGQFREDLYYRLSEIVLFVPPLRLRIGDPALLAHYFKNKIATAEGRPSMHFTEEALAAIDAYTWPGNVRELENCVKRAVIMADGPRISSEDLGLPAHDNTEVCLNLRQIRDEAERTALLKSLAWAGGNVAKAAELLGISRPTVYDLMNRHGLPS